MEDYVLLIVRVGDEEFVIVLLISVKNFIMMYDIEWVVFEEIEEDVWNNCIIIRCGNKLVVILEYFWSGSRMFYIWLFIWLERNVVEGRIFIFDICRWGYVWRYI